MKAVINNLFNSFSIHFQFLQELLSFNVILFEINSELNLRRRSLTRLTKESHVLLWWTKVQNVCIINLLSYIILCAFSWREYFFLVRTIIMMILLKKYVQVFRDVIKAFTFTNFLILTLKRLIIQKNFKNWYITINTIQGNIPKLFKISL